MTARAGVEAVVIDAARRRRLVSLTDRKGRVRIVAPHLVFVTGLGERRMHLWQVGGHSSGGVATGWKNVDPEDFAEAEVLDAEFIPQEDYNPDAFDHVVFAIPTRDGRQREPDAE
ncbi:MAG TPA: hypothetical protein VFQ45_20205 [Longimicrobium sp.]|nr:hypothetical protein [Longimicrobium sp.]